MAVVARACAGRVLNPGRKKNFGPQRETRDPGNFGNFGIYYYYFFAFFIFLNLFFHRKY
jgi:hypothetical protein